MCGLRNMRGCMSYRRYHKRIITYKKLLGRTGLGSFLFDQLFPGFENFFFRFFPCSFVAATIRLEY